MSTPRPVLTSFILATFIAVAGGSPAGANAQTKKPTTKKSTAKTAPSKKASATNQPTNAPAQPPADFFVQLHHAIESHDGRVLPLATRASVIEVLPGEPTTQSFPGTISNRESTMFTLAKPMRLADGAMGRLHIASTFPIKRYRPGLESEFPRMVMSKEIEPGKYYLVSTASEGAELRNWTIWEHYPPGLMIFRYVSVPNFPVNDRVAVTLMKLRPGYAGPAAFPDSTPLTNLASIMPFLTREAQAQAVGLVCASVFLPGANTDDRAAAGQKFMELAGSTSGESEFLALIAATRCQVPGARQALFARASTLPASTWQLLAHPHLAHLTHEGCLEPSPPAGADPAAQLEAWTRLTNCRDQRGRNLLITAIEAANTGEGLPAETARRLLPTESASPYYADRVFGVLERVFGRKPALGPKPTLAERIRAWKTVLGREGP